MPNLKSLLYSYCELYKITCKGAYSFMHMYWFAVFPVPVNQLFSLCLQFNN